MGGGGGDRALAAVLYYGLLRGDGRSEISYGFFRRQLDEKNIESVNIMGSKVYGEFKEAPLDPDGEDQPGRQLPAAEKEVRDHPAADGPADPTLDQELLRDV